MIKVQYPFEATVPKVSKAEFNTLYYLLLRTKVDEVKINDLLSKITLRENESLTLEKLLVDDFHSLVEYKELIKTRTLKKDLNSCFTIYRDKKSVSVYDNAQALISEFFMQQGINMKSCHYCNIDYINVFEERYSYKSIDDFIINAPKEILMKMPGVSEDTAKKIRNVRVWNNLALQLKSILTTNIYKKISQFINGELNQNLKNFDFKNIIVYKNHFTLDHFLPKGEFQLFSLSLYNLVPSCNSCNCKFKGAMEFLPSAKLKALSPTSKEYTLDKDLNFKLYFSTTATNFDDVVKGINILDDFKVEIENSSSLDGFETYLNMFKLRGRYEFHKQDALKLIQKRKVYSDSQIKEISNFLYDRGIYKDEHSIKMDLFGSQIFLNEEKSEPFTKYKKDIAAQLGLIDNAN